MELKVGAPLANDPVIFFFFFLSLSLFPNNVDGLIWIMILMESSLYSEVKEEDVDIHFSHL